MRTVVDASVILAMLMGETIDEMFLAKFEEAVAARKLVAPQLLFYEVVNGLRSNVLRKRLDLNEAVEAWHKYNDLEVGLVGQSGVGETVLGIAHKYGLSAYDAVYVALAQQNGWELWSLDKKLMDIGRIRVVSEN